MIGPYTELAIVTIEKIRSNCRSVNIINISDNGTDINDERIDKIPDIITSGIKGDMKILAKREPKVGA